MKTESTSVRLLLVIYLTLILLLALTVAASQFDLGDNSFLVATIIATSKAVLIAWYFMNVRQSPPLTRLVVVSGLLWLAILFTFALTDFWTRDPLRSTKSDIISGVEKTRLVE